MDSNTIKKKPSVRQKAALTNLVANGGNVAKAMRDAGYSPATARTPNKLLGASSIAGDMKALVIQLEKERGRAISNLSKTIKHAKYGDLIDASYKITKTLNLLVGKPTENISIGISDEHKARIEKILLGKIVHTSTETTSFQRGL